MFHLKCYKSDHVRKHRLCRKYNRTDSIPKDHNSPGMEEETCLGGKRDEMTIEPYNVILIIVKLTDVRRANVALQLRKFRQSFLTLASMLAQSCINNAM